jgi:hypothetical protein
MARRHVKPAQRRTPARTPVPRVENFRTDSLFPEIEHAVASILAKGKVVAPVEVLVAMHLLAPDRLEAWRRGRVPYLERVIRCNLTRLSRLLRILRFHAHDLRLVPTQAVYRREGKGPKQDLRFTKTGDPNLEAAYARHFVWPGRHGFGASTPVEAAVDVDEIPHLPPPLHSKP